MKEIKFREELNILLEKAEKQGYLTFDDVLTAFPEVEEDLAQLEDLLIALHERGIDIYESEEEALSGEAPPEEIEKAVDLSSIAADDTVSLYLREMASVPLLTPEEEMELAKRMARGRAAKERLARDGHDPEEREKLKRLIEEGEKAREHLIKANTRLVISIAKRYVGHGVPFLDLVQEGNLGLMKAVDKFDYRRGHRLSTYATWWIRQSITRALAEQGRTIRVPVHMSDRIRRLYKAARKLEQDLGYQPAPEEIAEEMDLEPEKVSWMLRASRLPLSLETPVGEEDNELVDFIEDEESLPPPEATSQSMLAEKLKEVLSTLSPREAQILRLRFGLQDGHCYTLEEVGQKFGLTRERIRQIEGEALRKLRHPRRIRQLKDFLS
ncbi:MAG TPA: sigma-70 family RNA polymerase sigma factor [Anaerolineae bacterium]|nr:sigma-70 family RNA polymerase sigma factor [Anaerolineae bacterium]